MHSSDALVPCRCCAPAALPAAGKTTLVDCLLRSAVASRMDNSSSRVMDSNAIEKERGITILSKCTNTVARNTRRAQSRALCRASLPLHFRSTAPPASIRRVSLVSLYPDESTLVRVELRPHAGWSLEKNTRTCLRHTLTTTTERAPFPPPRRSSIFLSWPLWWSFLSSCWPHEFVPLIRPLAALLALCCCCVFCLFSFPSGTSIMWKNPGDQKEYHINIVDTPGHADFGGEVRERRSNTHAPTHACTDVRQLSSWLRADDAACARCRSRRPGRMNALNRRHLSNSRSSLSLIHKLISSRSLSASLSCRRFLLSPPGGARAVDGRRCGAGG